MLSYPCRKRSFDCPYERWPYERKFEKEPSNSEIESWVIQNCHSCKSCSINTGKKEGIPCKSVAKYFLKKGRDVCPFLEII
jgi:hypothetical protein